MITVDRPSPPTLQQPFSGNDTHPEFAYLDDYQDAAASTDQTARLGLATLSFPLLGLFGEVGTLLSALKKKQRDRQSYAEYDQTILEEFGDVLWYFANIASRSSLPLSGLASRACAVREAWPINRAGENAITPDGKRSSADSPDFEAALIALGGRVGLLLHRFEQARGGTCPEMIADDLSAIFAALINAADVAQIDLREAARDNIEKTTSRWPKVREYTPLFDRAFPEAEQLPRIIEMHIIETRDRGKPQVIQLCNGVAVGSPLTDNKMIEDDYRFHDVFHLAYAAILGWSPCLRALLKVKRKSRPEVDENEDGARAALTEEGIATLVFQHALRLNYFTSITALDYSLLKSVKHFVAGYEVEQCSLWQWEHAILEGFAVFRKLRTFRRGVVIADLVSRSVTFEPHPNDR